MLKRELKANSKTFIIFLMILIGMLALVFSIYPSIIDSNVDINAMLEMFPKEILGTFNMDIISLNSVFGWLESEGYTFITLISGIYFSILGSTVLLKEQNDGTINYLYSKPISKSKILTNKILCGIIFLFIFNLLIGLTTFIGLKVNNDFIFKDWLFFTVAPFLLDSVIFLITLFISLFLKKTSKGMSIGIGVVFLMYIANIITSLSNKLSCLKYISIFYYMDSSQIINHHALNIGNIIFSGVVIMLMIILTYTFYNKKELGK